MNDRHPHEPEGLRPSEGRVPPNALDEEAAIISAVFLDRTALDRAVAILLPEHFYSDANRRIYEAQIALAAMGKPIDTVTVKTWLADHDMLQRAGGIAYLVQVVDAVPSVANVDDYARTVREKWRLRQLICACQRVTAEGYGPLDDAQAFIDSAEQEVFSIACVPESSEVQTVKAVVEEAFAELAKAYERGARIVGTPTRFVKLDAMLGGLHGGDLVIVAARPGQGKTALALDIAANVARPADPDAFDERDRAGCGALVFSLEMPRSQLGTRLMCSDARVDLSKLRTGQLDNADWKSLADSAARIVKLPIWIDDSSGITMLELRAKTRRIQARSGAGECPPLGLVVLDYLQLMRGNPKVSSREQQISELSRGLKLLAKDLRVPVIALSQLNRACETRGKDKRPQLSDLRECITGDQVVFDAVTGEPRTIREIAGGRVTAVYGLRDDWKLAVARVESAWSTGVKPVFKITTRTGRTLRVTANHPLRTLGGWERLDSLRTGQCIAVPRIAHQPAIAEDTLSDDELRMVGYLISDGHYGKHRTVSYVKNDPVLCADVRRIALERFGLTAKPKPCAGTSEQMDLTGDGSGPGSNSLINWLQAIGIHGQIGTHKRAPKEVFSHTDRAIGVFLGALWAGDGCVCPKKDGGWTLKFTNTSMGLLDDVHWLLTRLGIVAVRGGRERNSKSKVDISSIVVSEADAILRFSQMVSIPGVKGARLAEAAKRSGSCGRNARVDRLPLDLTSEVFDLAKASGMSWREIGYRPQGKRICRGDLATVATSLHSDRLDDLANSDVLWDPISSIEPDGEEETFDLRVPGMHNFVVGNIFAHNSGAIEQDADTVIFVYRDEYYDKDNPEVAGLAELIIAKQRNGPTGTIKVAFQKSCTRFSNLANEYDHDSSPSAPYTEPND